MAHTLQYFALFATAMLFGSMVFFSAVMAPLIFIKMDGERAGRFIRQVFPWYYLVVLVLGGVATVCLVFQRPIDAAILGGVTCVAAATRQLLMPAINRARDAMLAGDESSGQRFSRLHRLSVWINAAQIIAIAIVLARFV